MAKACEEGKAWEPSLSDGRLNTNSYAASAAFGLVELAVEELHRAGRPLKFRSVKALTGTFAAVIDPVHESVRGAVSLNSGLHSRLRGALRTTITTMPLPFGGDSDAWGEWVEKAQGRVHAIAKIALSMWEDDTADADDEDTDPASPWTVLATPNLSVVEGGE